MDECSNLIYDETGGQSDMVRLFYCKCNLRCIFFLCGQLMFGCRLSTLCNVDVFFVWIDCLRFALFRFQYCIENLCKDGWFVKICDITENHSCSVERSE